VSARRLAVPVAASGCRRLFRTLWLAIATQPRPAGTNENQDSGTAQLLDPVLRAPRHR